ncbi:AraC family transcriptional regulator [Shimia sp. R9_1]|nr:AraC family transcriptional regulator [Shimia sp. R9_1]
MLDMSLKRPAGSIRILCEAAPNYGVSSEQCLQGTGLVTFDLYNNDTQVTIAQEVAVIGNFLKHTTNRPGLGVEIGRLYRPEVFGIWGYAIVSSPSLRAGLKTAVDFANLSFLIAQFKLERAENSTLLIYDTDGLPPSVKTFVLERHLTVFTNFTSEVLPKLSLAQMTVESTLNAPENAAAIQKLLGLKVIVNSDRNAIVVPDHLMDTPLPRHDPATMEQCLQQCRSLLNLTETAPNDMRSKVREAILLNMNNEPTIASISAKLGVSERTLRRRLSAEGASFRQIFIEARLAIGHELLSTAGLDVTTVAWRTGYSESSSFVRAFTKQYGYSPGSLKQSA